jgi:hypothetical protein
MARGPFPYSKPGSTTDVVHDHTSVLATIQAKWNRTGHRRSLTSATTEARPAPSKARLA